MFHRIALPFNPSSLPGSCSQAAEGLAGDVLPIGGAETGILVITGDWTQKGAGRSELHGLGLSGQESFLATSPGTQTPVCACDTCTQDPDFSEGARLLHFLLYLLSDCLAF